MIRIPRIKVIAFTLFMSSVLVFILPALRNGYPLTLPDTGAILSIGHGDEVPVGMSIVYPLIVRHLSLSWSNWLVVFVQSLVLNYLIYLLSNHVLKLKNCYLFHLFLSIVLVITTPIAFYVSLISSEIFTPIFIISFFLLLVKTKKSISQILLLTIIVAFSFKVHQSHIVLALVGITVYCLTMLWNMKLKNIKTLIIPIFALLLGHIVHMYMNVSKDGTFNDSQTTYIVPFYRIMKSGIANEYLIKKCDSSRSFIYHDLCNYLHEFGRWPSLGHFLYESDSPLYSGSCSGKQWKDCWIEKNKHYKIFINDLLEVGNFRNDYIAFAGASSLNQLINFSTPSLGKYDFSNQIRKYYETEIFSYHHSIQYQKGYTMEKESLLHVIIVDVSIFLLVIALLSSKFEVNREDRLLILLFVGFCFFNALLYAVLYGINPINQSKVMLILPLICYLIISKKLLKEIKKDERFKLL